MHHFLNDSCPLKPTPKQQAFLALDCLEAFFGGAAGGGKSVALLMGALQYVHVPGYAALILRKDTQRLGLPGGLIPRSHDWLAGKKARWNEARRTWTFPHENGPPATLTFGYLCKPADKFRYLSSEFQYIAFDELTELAEDDYLYLFSRLRKPKSLNVPLRIRSASNPGGPGHLWVKARFMGDSQGSEVRVQGSEGECSGGNSLNPEPRTLNSRASHERVYLPSRLADNEHLDAEEYRQSLMHLMPVTRERLMNGDWSVQEKGFFEPEWFRYYLVAGEQFELLQPGGALFRVIPQNDCRFFITVDPAGTSDESQSDQHDFSVIQVWAQPTSRQWSHCLLLREQQRQQVSLPRLGESIAKMHRKWKQNEKVWIEGEKLGHALIAELRKELPEEVVQAVPTGNKSKEARAVPLANKMKRGEVFLPENEILWRPAFERELLAWTGHKRERCDQIDAAAYAAIIAERQQPAVFTIEHFSQERV